MTSPITDFIFAFFFTSGFCLLFYCTLGAVQSLRALRQLKKAMAENERELQKLLREIEDESKK